LRKSTKVIYVQEHYLEYRSCCEILRKSMVQPDRPQIQHGACALHAG